MNDYSWDDSIRLVHHYRTAPNIIEIADKIMSGKLGHTPMLPTQEYKGDITPVEVFGKIELSDQLKVAVARISKQVDIYPGQKIGIITPRNEELNQVWAALSTSPELLSKVTNPKNRDFDPSKPVWVSTMHSAKGLEFRCVHILAADMIKQFNEHSRRLAFTGVTRAKTSLSIYHHQDLLPFFSAALAEKVEKKVTLDHVFGKLP
jgi:superfamily I DNA/RNA helicase